MKNLLLVDTSYLIFYRFFALRIWYKKANSDLTIPNDYDWLSDETFMEKYKKLFFECIFKICKKKNILHEDVYFCIDCKSDKNWRKQINETYKINRPESHKRCNFYSFGIFKIVINGYLEEFKTKYNSKIVKHYCSEADDIVFNMTKEYYNKYANIFIVASDTDYLQICNNKIDLIDTKMNSIRNKHLVNINNKKYLVKKILSGDTADNIFPCKISRDILKFYGIEMKGTHNFLKCTKKLAEEIISNESFFMYISNIIESNRKIKIGLEGKYKDIYNKIHDDISENSQFSKNQFMIDMEMTPYIEINNCIC